MSIAACDLGYDAHIEYAQPLSGVGAIWNPEKGQWEETLADVQRGIKRDPDVAPYSGRPVPTIAGRAVVSLAIGGITWWLSGEPLAGVVAGGATYWVSGR